MTNSKQVRLCADYIAACKERLGRPSMSDRALGEVLGYTQQNIARAKAGYMTDPIAMKVAELLEIDPGEVLIVARAEREKDEHVKAALVSYVGKIAGRLPLLGANSVPELTLVDGQMQNAPMVSHGGVTTGGEGGIRTLGTLFTYA